MLRRFFPRKPELKSPSEIALMRKAGKVVAKALTLCREMAKPGVRTQDIDKAVEDIYARNDARPLFKGYPGRVPFPGSTCLSINEQVIHGIPSQRSLRNGDLLKAQTACQLGGWCADAAVSIVVGEAPPEWCRLARVAKELLVIAREEIGRRSRWSEVALRIQLHTESQGFNVVKQYVGHGIGRIWKESPQVPNVINRDILRQDFYLEEGLVLAVQPIINMGTDETATLPDHWPVVTRDGMPSAYFKHTFAIVRGTVLVLTGDEECAADSPAPRVQSLLHAMKVLISPYGKDRRRTQEALGPSEVAVWLRTPEGIAWEEKERRKEDMREQERQRRRKEAEEAAARNAWKIYHESKTMGEIAVMSGTEFEKFLARLFSRMGYTDIRLTPANDQGGDILCVSPSGTEIVIQAKRWKGTVGNSAVQELLGALVHYDRREGMVVTNSTFTVAARELATKARLLLCDGTWLAEQIKRSLPPQIPDFEWDEYNRLVKEKLVQPA
jgi:methionyl aminopeptidase